MQDVRCRQNLRVPLPLHQRQQKAVLGSCKSIAWVKQKNFKSRNLGLANKTELRENEVVGISHFINLKLHNKVKTRDH